MRAEASWSEEPRGVAVARGVRGLGAEPGRAVDGVAVGSGASPCSCPGFSKNQILL